MSQTSGRMHKIVLFDFDGTLFDTRSVDTLAVNALRDELGLSPLPDGEILSYVGQTNNAFITNCFGVDPKGDLTEISARFAYWELYFIRHGARLFDGAAELLFSLKSRGLVLALCSNGSREYITSIFDTLDLWKHFNEVYFNTPGMEKEMMIAEVLQKYKGDERNSVMVGDRIMDIEAARANGIPVIGVTFGFGGNEPYDADRTADSFSELERSICDILSV